MNPGEGAFYGPKLEFVLKDCLGRDWQLGTLQVDFVLPERLGATFVNKEGNKERPVMLHRAILGSFERFIGILIEHYGGKLPLWLAPIQVVVAPLTSAFLSYAQEVCAQLKRHNIRYTLDDRSEKIAYKVREHSLQKIPLIVVVGAKEQESHTLSVRFLGDTKDHTISMNVFLDQCFSSPS
jgi:threonyl-tRNA synthetase